MRSKAAVVFLVLGAVLLWSVPVASAQTVTGTLSGHVRDASGGVMPKVKVTAKNEQTGGQREATTNDEGYYLISFLPIGTYEATAAMTGFRTVEKKGVVVELNKNTVSDFTLEPAGVATVVEVEAGEIPLIETTVGELKHSLDAKMIEATPLAGRNFISLVEQIPGFQNAPFIGSSNNPTNSTGSYVAASGTGSRSATFQIDGVNNDDSSENQNRQNVNISSIKEFQVLTNAYSAEFGRAGGAVVLVQTKSGTNSLHGDLYDFIQNDIFNANGFFQNQRGTPPPRVRRNQYGGTLGGPVFKDKLFFFASGERVSNVGTTSITRFVWLPSDGPRACDPRTPNDKPRPGRAAEPLGNYCVDPSTHPNLGRDLAFIKSVMDLWKTPQLQGKTPDPKDTTLCPDLLPSGRPNRCVRVDGLPVSIPNSDYSGKIDWLPGKNTTLALRYQYSRQLLKSPRVILGDNFGTRNDRQYNLGLTLTHVFTVRQTGEFRYGFGNRVTLQDVTDGNQIPTIRFANTLTNSGTVIGTSTNVPINRRQRDHQLVYNHTIVFNRHTLRTGIDQRFQALDDIASNAHRGFWSFGTLDSIGLIRKPTETAGFTGWENFLRGFVTSFTKGFGPAFAENRFGETNLYLQDDLRLRRNLTLNLGVRWEGVRAPDEIGNRFDYGFDGDYNNVQPRIGFAWTPEAKNSLLAKLTGGPGNFVIRGGYGIFHSRLFQSIFSQSGLSIRAQPPNGFTFGGPPSQCNTNLVSGNFEISDPTCGFVFVPGQATRSTRAPCSLTSAGCGADGQGVKVAGGQLLGSLLIPDPGLHLPYVQQWNLTFERKLPWKMAVQLAYAGNRGIGLPFFSGINDAQFPITSPLVTADLGGGNFRPVVFDLVCKDFTDPCVSRDKNGNLDPNASGSLRQFVSLTAETVTDPNGRKRRATLADKGIVIINGVPHGYISLNATRTNERRPDPTNGRNVRLSNFAWTYYNGMILKVTKAASNGLTFTASWTLSKTIDTGSEATFTGVDVNAPTGSRNPAGSLRGLSAFDARHRFVLSYSYELPWMKSQQGVLGRILGGWTLSGVTTFQSGNPFTVLAGYDVNLDGVGGDRPRISDPSFLGRSVDNGRSPTPCPTPGVAVCPDTLSQNQLPGGVFIPTQSGSIPGNLRIVTPGDDGSGTIGRNTFFTQGINNFDMAMSKSVRIRESMKLELRLEGFNLFNRTMFDVPSRTILSGTPLGRITQQRNPANFINSGREFGSRFGQLALRFTF